MRSQAGFAAALAMPALLSCAVAVRAETMPRPTIDFAVTAKTSVQDGSIKLAHSKGKVRLDISAAGMPGTMTSFVDPKRKKMIMLAALPGMSNMAIEMELPDEFSFTDMPLDGTKVGADKVAGEDCDIWRSTGKVGSDPVEACITADGIVLRTAASINGTQQVVFEAVELQRAPQDPSLFELPKGVKVTKIPKGMQGMLPGIPGLPGFGK